MPKAENAMLRASHSVEIVDWEKEVVPRSNNLFLLLFWCRVALVIKKKRSELCAIVSVCFYEPRPLFLQ